MSPSGWRGSARMKPQTIRAASEEPVSTFGRNDSSDKDCGKDAQPPGPSGYNPHLDRFPPPGSRTAGGKGA